MTIAKVGKSGKSAGAIAYVLSENRDGTKEPEILAGSFGTASEIKAEFEIYNKLNTRVRNQASHITISLHPGETLCSENKIQFAERLLEKLNFRQVPFLVVEHFDKDYEHFHIVAGRIREDGTTVKEWKIAERAIRATKTLEKEYGLIEVEYKKSSNRTTTRNEYKQMERTGELSVMAEAKLVIDRVLESRPHTRKFVETMQIAGFEVIPNLSKTNGTMNGFSFKKDEIKFKSSSIARDYSWKNLQTRGLDYQFSLDTEYLRGVKDEFAKKFTGEVGRGRATETAKSITDRTESASIGTKSVATGIESGTDRFQSILRGNPERNTLSLQSLDLRHSDSSGRRGDSETWIIETLNDTSRKSREKEFHQSRHYYSGIREIKEIESTSLIEPSRATNSEGESHEPTDRDETLNVNRMIYREPEKTKPQEIENDRWQDLDYSMTR